MTDVAVITTGGTIGSLRGSEQIAIDEGSAVLNHRLTAMAEEVGVPVRIMPAANRESSEFEAEDWMIFADVIERCIGEGHDSIVLTHGTDTLHFTAAFLAVLFRDSPVKICLTGAFYPPNHEASDADANMRAALRAAASDSLRPGVYAAFHDADCDGIGVIPATDLVPPRFDEAHFRQLYADLPHVTNAVAQAQSIFTKIDWAKLPRDITSDGLKRAKSQVATALLFPGIDMRIYDSLPTGGALLIEGYHSGTASSARTETSLLALHERRSDLVLAICSVPSPNVPIPYAGSKRLKDAGVLVYRDLPLHLLLVAQMIGTGQGLTAREALAAFDAYLI
ncbi:asparaginase [Stakelama sp. CBK3Z-3]|uniref:Asparaginase n=1 Tax=Stakelama flava TaxID=2860338 RepID=A0ABS6XNS2_9SPHN|nr:asparaginase domain-containing protein [Stakelama flava]MBW4331868.1 asparaginase [Stakelama flava]